MEAAQARLTVISGVRDDFRRDAYQEWLDPIEIETLQQSLLRYLPTRRYANVPNYDAETLEDDLACELESIRAAGVQNVVVINLTRAEFGLPVVRVIIPGLEPALGPGYRLGPRARRAISDCL
jgi:ribosomal protein S12 methylthiotransferase accessory factor